MRLVKCKRCGELIDRTKEEFVTLSSGYAHKKCEDDFQTKKNTVICQKCRGTINKLTDDFIKKNNGYVHKNCISVEDEDRTELYNYICEIFKLKSPGPVNIKLVSKFHTELNYSYKSMYYTLKYYYEIKKGSIEKSQQRIGILPYVYDEAKSYYDNITRTQNIILHNVEKQFDKKENVVIVKYRTPKKIKDIDLEDLN